MHKILGGLALLFIGHLAAAGQGTWTIRHKGNVSAPVLWGITSGPAGLMTVGTQGTVMRSLDGIAWETLNAGNASWLLSVTYGKGQYIAVGEKGLILSSKDGTRWDQVGAGLTYQRLNQVLFGHEMFVAVGEGETILISTDGVAWRLANTGGSHWLRALLVDSTRNQWLAAGQAGTVFVSQDGLVWSKQPQPFAIDIESLAQPFLIGTSLNGPVAKFEVDFEGVGGAFVSYIWPFVSTVQNDFQPQLGSLTVPQGTDSYGHYLRTITSGNDGFIIAGSGGFVAFSQGGGTSETVDAQADYNSSTIYHHDAFVVGSLSEIAQHTFGQSAPRFVNISTRSFVRNGEQVMIAGTIISGTENKTVLVRGLGPTLANFGISNFLPDPRLQVLDEHKNVLVDVTSWSESVGAVGVKGALAKLGASLDPSLKDSALVVSLPPGAYTFILQSASGKEGVGLVDLFDLDDSSMPVPLAKPINVSTRAYVGSGEKTLIAGLIISGEYKKKVFVRALGPILSKFGIAQPLPDPVITVHNADGQEIAGNDDWQSGSSPTDVFGRVITGQELQTMMAANRLLALDGFSKESALVLSLEPGAYTIQVSGKNGASGTALVEAYELPY